jgi:hypothetical protein
MESKGMNWQKSSYSGGNGGPCVEVANADHVMVRDTTQHGAGPVLAFSTAAWAEFTAALKA